MNRFKDFAQFEDRQFNDADTVLEFSGVTCDVYRPVISGVPGFGNEVGEEIKIKRMLVHIARQAGVLREGVDGGIKANKVSFIGICADDDVRIGDIWEIESKRYRVRDVDTGSKGKTEVRLELFV